MELVLLPSLIAICLKIAIFLRYHESLHREHLNLGLFFLAVFALNLIELFAINQNHNQQTNLLLLLAYYCSAVFIIHAYVNIAMHYSNFRWHVARVKAALNVLLGMMVLGLILSRSIIADVQVVEFSLTKVAGPNYWLFQLYALGCLSFALVLLGRGIRHVRSNIGRQQCLMLLLSTTMPSGVAVTIILLQAMGIQITAALFMSFALTLMLAIIVFTEEKTRLFTLLTLIPLTKERRLHKQLVQKVSRCISLNDDPTQEQSLNLKGLTREIEGLLIEHMLDYYEGNQKLAASALGVSEATVSRRARAANRQHCHHSDSSVIISSKE